MKNWVSKRNRIIYFSQGRNPLLLVIILFSLVLLSQCKEPIGWTAYGQSIEFSDNPIASTGTNGTFDFTAAKARLSLGKREVNNVFHFCAPHGSSNPGLILGSEAEMRAAWVAAGFKEINNEATSVNPYSGGLGFDQQTEKVFDIYAVANEVYKIEGGREISPWRVSEPTSVDMSPFLNLRLGNVLGGVGIESIRITQAANGYEQTITDPSFSSGGTKTLRLTGLDPLVGKGSLQFQVIESNSYTEICSTYFTTSITMGQNSLSSSNNTTYRNVNTRIYVTVDGAVPFTRYRLWAPQKNGISNAVTEGYYPGTQFSARYLFDTGYIIFEVERNNVSEFYRRDFVIDDLVRATSTGPGYYLFQIQTMEVPVLNPVSCTSDSVSFSLTPVAGASSYNLYRDGVKVQTNITSTTFTDTGLSAGTAYNYQIAPVGSTGEGPQSAVKNVLYWEVKYNLNGASGTAPDSQYVFDGASVTLPPNNYAPSGFSVTGIWSKTSTGTQDVGGEGTPYQPTGNSELYVKLSTTISGPRIISATRSGSTLTVVFEGVAGTNNFYRLYYKTGSSSTAQVGVTPPTVTFTDYFGGDISLDWNEVGSPPSPKTTVPVPYP